MGGVPGPEDLLDVLLAGGRRAESLTHLRHLPARAGTTAPWPEWADPDLVAGYTALGVTRPWQHQVEAADAAWCGSHVALGTSTGSGKSMAFWLPALTAVRAEQRDHGRIENVRRRPSVLYLCPTKALAADQSAALTRLLDAAGTRDVRVATCDGDTPFAERVWVQDHADVVLTNPDFLHFSLLSNHGRWVRFLRSLRYVVVDEGHAFRGVFGAHVALVLRRLRRLAAYYGAPDPVFVVASATTAEPDVSAARLIGVAPGKVRAVVGDTSPAGRKTFALWEPPVLPDVDGMDGFVAAAPGRDADEWWVETPPDEVVERPRRSATAEAADLLADLTAAGARTLAFTRSRRGAESVALHAGRVLSANTPALANAVAAYRGGYLPEERRALEQAIRTGALRALATTNALELGVDISGLDAVLIVGWPGTRMSIWQQAGRAGRAGADGLVALIAREDPLDTYLVHHPEAVFDAPLEATVFDPGNPYVLAPHLCAAAAEVPIRPDEVTSFGPRAAEVLDVLVAKGALRRRPAGWFWTHPGNAAGMTDLRGSGGEPVRVVEGATGRLLGTVDAGGADGAVHPGAVYVHQGASFVVDELDLADHVALVHRKDVDYGTWSHDVTSIAVQHVAQERTWGADDGVPTPDGRGQVGWGLGEVDVTTQVVSYQKRRLPGMEVLGSFELDLPERSLTTTAVWWTADAALLEAAGVTGDLAPGALHAAEHAAIGLLPLLATCDRWDLGGVSTALHIDTGAATVFVYDAYPGGAGFAERGYELAETWLRATRDAIASCPCAAGCPACVQSPKCGTQNSPLEKDAAVRLLDAVLALAPAGEGAVHPSSRSQDGPARA
ncbi:DEAD/DEAH box helicase domain-containing protein [Flavimobilis marinus]|uniref:DEAD/DEAH box helicase domain-containing protein n=1 Tax=Flavimobilis marinus TaxID=285351 RepID=A0A1I2GZ44_9MICO|nr:DEAD/DEAH box helicase [Flavimobilis marinus]SFF22420.1 DEAD/DEAH box helicase domain-containing protein [Flavimobilis marinus]